jgi:hypothetical protein
MTNLFFCPNCGSQNVAAIYSIPVGKVSLPPEPSRDRCLNCRYEELRGHFKMINTQKVREKKIDSILNGIS